MTDRTEVLNGLFVGLPDALASDLFVIATNQQRPIEDVVEQLLLQSIQRWIADHPLVPD